MINFRSDAWENLDEIEADELLREIRPDAERGHLQAMLVLETEIKTVLSGRRSGRMYQISGRGRAPVLHVASAPGEPPAVLYGNLRNSIGHTSQRWIGTVLVGEVGVGLGQSPRLELDPGRTYARRLELGGSDSRGGYIAPRPYMVPAERNAAPKMSAILERTVGS